MGVFRKLLGGHSMATNTEPAGRRHWKCYEASSLAWSKPWPLPRMSKVIAVHSYRGGTRKSHFTANLATAVAMQGTRVGVADTDLPSPGIHNLARLHLSLLRDLQRVVDLDPEVKLTLAAKSRTCGRSAVGASAAYLAWRSCPARPLSLIGPTTRAVARFRA